MDKFELPTKMMETLRINHSVCSTHFSAMGRMKADGNIPAAGNPNRPYTL